MAITLTPLASRTAASSGLFIPVAGGQAEVAVAHSKQL